MSRRMEPKSRSDFRAKVRALVKSDVWTGVSFVSAGLLGFLALTEFRTGPIIAGLLGLGMYGFMAYVIPARADATKPDESTAPRPSDDPRVDLLVEAHQHLATLSKSAAKLPVDLKATIRKLVEDGTVVAQAVTSDPDKLTPILRFFTYYLPATADLAQDRLKLAPHAGSERLAEIDQTLVRLGEAFAGFRAAALEPDLASVDLDITLLDDALDADLEDLKTK
jgi:hypothetical protein